MKGGLHEIQWYLGVHATVFKAERVFIVFLGSSGSVPS